MFMLAGIAHELRRPVKPLGKLLSKLTSSTSGWWRLSQQLT